VPFSLVFLASVLGPASVTEMNKARFVSSRSVCYVPGTLIKMTRLVRPCQFFLAPTSSSGSWLKEGEELEAVRSVLKYRYGYVGSLTRRFLITPHQRRADRGDYRVSRAPRGVQFGVATPGDFPSRRGTSAAA